MSPLLRLLGALVDKLDTALAIVDHRGELACVNDAARRLRESVDCPEENTWIDVTTAGLAEQVRQFDRPREVTAQFDADNGWWFRLWPLGDGRVAVAMRRDGSRRHVAEIVASSFDLSAEDAGLAVLVSQGLSNRQIAERLGIVRGTVASRLWRLYRKLGVPNRASLATRVAKVLPPSQVRLTVLPPPAQHRDDAEQ